MRRYYTLKEAAEMLGATENEVLQLVNTYLIAGNLLRVDKGVLLGRDGLKRLSRLLKSEQRNDRCLRLKLKEEKRIESLADWPEYRPVTEGDQHAEQQQKEEEEAGSTVEPDGKKPDAKPWHDYSWPLSEWVRLTGKKPHHL